MLDAETGGVELAWRPPEDEPDAGGAPAEAAGLAFDAECRLYRSVPAEGRVLTRSCGRAGDPPGRTTADGVPVDLFEGPPLAGRWPILAGRRGAARRRCGRRAGSRSTADDRLFVAESGAGRRPRLRPVEPAGCSAAVAAPAGARRSTSRRDGDVVLCVLADGRLVRLTARTTGRSTSSSATRPTCRPTPSRAGRGVAARAA